ncbi:MAG: 30S ribosomal protein S1 [Chloroflexota bacterium]
MTTSITEQNGDNRETTDVAVSFEDLLDQYDYTLPQRGQILQGEILRVEDDAIFMDVGAKRDAIVPHTDLDRLEEDLVQSLKRGAEIPVYVLKTPVGDEELLVSINKGLEQKDWDRAERLIDKDETLELDVVGYNKGGLLVKFGQLQGFVPNSHVPDLRYGGNQSEVESRKARQVGETLLVKVLEVSQQRRRLIFSAKAAHKEQRKRRLRDLEIGSVIEGRVANIVNYGAFVDLGGGVSGLLHVSELAWHRVEHPSKVLEVGEELEVEIQDVDVERERVSLSRKAVLPNPWDTIEERYNIGDLIAGEVTNVEDFGAFVEVQSGVVGLVHVSEIDIFGPASIHDIIRTGDEVLVRIIDIDPYEERLSLSLRRVTSEEQIEWMRRQEEAEEAAAEAEAEVEAEEATAEAEAPAEVEAEVEAEEAATEAETEAEAEEAAATEDQLEASVVEETQVDESRAQTDEAEESSEAEAVVSDTEADDDDETVSDETPAASAESEDDADEEEEVVA